MPYSDMNTLFDAANPKGALNYWKSGFLRELSDDAIDTMVDEFRRCPSSMSAMFLEHFSTAPLPEFLPTPRLSPTGTLASTSW